MHSDQEQNNQTHSACPLLLLQCLHNHDNNFAMNPVNMLKWILEVKVNILLMDMDTNRFGKTFFCDSHPNWETNMGTA